ncbi:MAG: hypothetical protein K4571_13055 [Deltaproteobacteria bacterium]
MKRIFFTLTLLFAASFAYAQTSPEAYLAQLPATPKSACILTAAEKASYIELVRGLQDKMVKDVLRRQEESQAYVDANRDTIPAGRSQQPGSAEKITGKSGRTLKEERKAVSEQMQIEQKALVGKIDARKNGIISRFKTLNQNASAMKAKEIDPLERQMASLGGLITSKEQSDRLDQMAIKLRNAQKRYCDTYSPQYRALLDEYLSAIKDSLPDYRRLEVIVAKTQMGLDQSIDAHTGQLGIEALRDYTAMLAKVFKYDLPYEY